MRTIILENEQSALDHMQRLCAQLPQVEVVATFREALEMLHYLEEHEVDLLLTESELPGLDGVEVVRRLRQTNSDLGVIFVTANEQHALQAFQLAAVDYLVKPCTQAALARGVARAQMLMPRRCRVSIRTFGYFAVFLDEEPVRFSNSKAKELLALLVDRNGGVVTMEQAVDLLWEERAYDDTVKRLYRKAVGHLQQLFLGTGFFRSDRGSCYICPSQASCDLFQMLDNPMVGRRRYHGEYLLDYSWGELTNGKLSRL